MLDIPDRRPDVIGQGNLAEKGGPEDIDFNATVSVSVSEYHGNEPPACLSANSRGDSLGRSLCDSFSNGDGQRNDYSVWMKGERDPVRYAINVIEPLSPRLTVLRLLPGSKSKVFRKQRRAIPKFHFILLHVKPS